jgi:hypothetical protein
MEPAAENRLPAVLWPGSAQLRQRSGIGIRSLEWPEIE